MNILVISDQFKKGGLETHIDTFWRMLREEHEMWFCFADYEPSGLLNADRVLTGFHFSFDATVGEVRQDVERLVALIREHHIDVLHVHPWFALYTAYFAAALTGIKLVYSYHAPSSVIYHGNLCDELLMEEILTGAVSHVFCVGEQGIRALSSIHCDNASLLPNPITLSAKQAEPDGSRTWALMSRLDEDKAPSVARLLSVLPELDIDAVDIYGDGACFSEIRDLAKKSSKPVRMMGFCSDVNERLLHGYRGVIGTDRCAMEALAAGLPVLLVGYGNICGMIDEALYARASRLNFVAESFPEISIEQLNSQLREVCSAPERFCFRNRIAEDFDPKTLAERYLATLEQASAGAARYAAELYEKVAQLPPETPFHESKAIFAALREVLLPNTRNLHVKDHLLQQLLEERERTGAVYDLRTELGAIDQRLYATRVEMHAADQAQIKQAQENVEALRQQNDALAAETAALREQLDRAQREIDALTARLNTTTLGYLVRQTARHKVLEPLKHFKRLRG